MTLVSYFVTRVIFINCVVSQMLVLIIKIGPSINVHTYLEINI